MTETTKTEEVIVDVTPTESTELEQRPSTGVATATELTIEQVLAQVNLVQEVMRQAMKEGVHYGRIPGVAKPSLFKPGAETLCLTFRLKPSYRYERITDDGHITYLASCTLTHINSGSDWAEGVGSCTSREDRYAYRWQKRDQRPSKERQDALKAEGMGRFRKVRGAWEWQERFDNPAVLELDNTILKMAAKRALVAAVLNALAVSDIFTQDVEDTGPAAPTPEPPPAEVKAEPEQATADAIELLRAAIALTGSEQWTEENVVRGARQRWGNVQKLEDLTAEQVEQILGGIEAWQRGQT